MKMKRTLALLLSLMLTVSLLATPTFATDASGTMSVKASSTTAPVGSTVTYTIYFEDCVNVVSYTFRLKIPEGLEYVSGSAQYSENFESTTGFAAPNFNDKTLKAYTMGTKVSSPYNGSVEVMTFQCTVQEGAWGEYTASLVEYGFSDREFKDAVCNLDTSAATITVSCNHDQWGEWIPDEDHMATCTEGGKEYRLCQVPGCQGREERDTDPLGHDFVLESTTESTCYSHGYEHYVCSRNCGETKDEELPLADHVWNEGVVTQEPTCTTEGNMHYECVNHEHCGAEKDEVIPATGHDYKDGVCVNCGEKEPVDPENPTPPSPVGPKPTEDPVPVEPTPSGKTCPSAEYTDVIKSAWYHEAVDYVIDAGLMNGIGNNKFDPQGTVTRAMVATVLWRMNGSPIVENAATFTDVEAGSWYAAAVAWAEAEGIITGINDTTFDPMGAATREQIAVMLWRMAGKPEVAETTLRFADSDEIDTWALDAMRYVVAEGLFIGDNNNHLNPLAKITRAELATILMRLEGGSYTCNG